MPYIGPNIQPHASLPAQDDGVSLGDPDDLGELESVTTSTSTPGSSCTSSEASLAVSSASPKLGRVIEQLRKFKLHAVAVPNISETKTSDVGPIVDLTDDANDEPQVVSRESSDKSSHAERIAQTLKEAKQTRIDNEQKKNANIPKNPKGLPSDAAPKNEHVLPDHAAWFVISSNS